MEKLVKGFYLKKETADRLNIASILHKIPKSDIAEGAINTWLNKFEQDLEETAKGMEKAMVCLSMIDSSGVIINTCGKIIEDYVFEKGTFIDGLWDKYPLEGGLWVWEGKPFKDNSKVGWKSGSWRRPNYVEWAQIISGNPRWPAPLEKKDG
jgi:hypothetical protein